MSEREIFRRVSKREVDAAIRDFGGPENTDIIDLACELGTTPDEVERAMSEQDVEE